MSRFRNIFSHFALNAVVLMFLILSLLFGCEKFEAERIVRVKTSPITNVSDTSCVVLGTILDIGENDIIQHGFFWAVTQNPTTENDSTQLGLKSSTGNFFDTLTGLSAGITYYVRAYASNSVEIVYGNEVSFTTYISRETVMDYDGNTYNTVQIGNQVWMAENLKVTHYPDGTAIQLVEDNSAWDALDYTDKAYCYYNNNSSNVDTYGALYPWAAAMNGASSSDANPSGVQGVCPNGWHLPSDTEWKELEMYLGMSQAGADSIDWRGTDEGGKLKETGETHWFASIATNSSGFSALPGGDRDYSGNYYHMGKYAYFWSSTEYGSSDAWYRNLYYQGLGVKRYFSNKESGFSVRCIRNK